MDNQYQHKIKVLVSLKNAPSKREEIYVLSLQTISGIKFTMREVDIIACIVNNRGTKKIASILSISPRTASTHLHNIFTKLHNSSRDYIIDFVQKAGKLLDLKWYYFSIITENAFVRTLSSIKKLLRSQEVFCSLSYDKNIGNAGTKFLNQLTTFLSESGITIVGTDQTKQAIYDIYILNSDTQHYNENSIILVLDEDLSKERIEGVKYINFTENDNFYFSFLELVKHLTKNPGLKDILEDFQHEFQSTQNLLGDNKMSVSGKAAGHIQPPHFKMMKIGIIICLVMLIAIVCIQLFHHRLPNFILNNIDLTNDAPTTWNIPRQNIVFVGREKLLNELETTLLKNDPNKSNTLTITACTGLGGIGKTQLALQYILHTHHPYTMKLWFNGEDTKKLKRSYYDLALALGYHTDGHINMTSISYVKKWLAAHPGWLMVIDNVDNYNDIEVFLPEKGGHVILTTRKRDWPASFTTLPIDTLSESEAVDTISILIKDKSSHEQEHKKELAATLGYLPLALSQAGAYIHQNNISVEEYITLYNSHALNLLSSNSLPEGVKTSPVAITWDISLQSILQETAAQHEPPIAIELITVCSYLAPDKISMNLLLSWLKYRYPDLPDPELTLNKHIGLLWKYSMINYDIKDNISIHKLVQTVLRHQLTQAIDKKHAIFPNLNLQWYTSLLHFFIINESEFKLSNSFVQLLETRKQFLSVFKDYYNDDVAGLDLTVAPVYYYQERYEEFKNLLDRVNSYLSTKSNREFLKTRLLYLYSAYFRKQENYKLAEEKIQEASNMFNKIKNKESLNPKEIDTLKAKILFNQANLIFARNKSLPVQNRNVQGINSAIRLTKEDTILFTKNHDIRNKLKSIELRGRLSVLLNNGKSVIEEFEQYKNLLENISDQRVKMNFYLTYSDAYITLSDYYQALAYCNRAKVIATKLDLKLQVKTIDEKIAIIMKSMYGT